VTGHVVDLAAEQAAAGAPSKKTACRAVAIFDVAVVVDRAKETAGGWGVAERVTGVSGVAVTAVRTAKKTTLVVVRVGAKATKKTSRERMLTKNHDDDRRLTIKSTRSEATLIEGTQGWLGVRVCMTGSI